jgi:thiol-disulfide isomerase/thioredoxin
MSNPAKTALTLLAVVTAGLLGYNFYRWLHTPPDLTPAEIASAGATAAPQAPKIPEIRPVFSLKDRDDKLRAITEWDGKSLVINFWATWCAPCRREIPMLRELHAARSAQDIEVIGIAVDFRENVLAYINEVEIDYPLLIGEQDGLDAATAFGLGSMGFPFTVFTDNRGRIVAAHLGELHRNQADLILDTVVDVNEGELSLEEAKIRITTGLAQLDAQST